MSKEYEYETRPIAGYEGKYSVSNTGEVFSHDYKRTGKTKQLKPGKDKDGYLKVNLHQDGKIKHYRVHRLVLDAFVPNPENKPCCDHLDTNRVNNNVSNLRWVTRKENQNNPLTRKNLSNALRGSTLSKETRNKISEAMKGKKCSEEVRKKISESTKGKKHGRYDHTKYTFRNNNTAEVFVGSQYDFRNKYNLDQGNISRLINGKHKCVKGWVKIYEWGKK